MDLHVRYEGDDDPQKCTAKKLERFDLATLHATDRAVPTWMASHMSQADAEWMAAAMGFGPQEAQSDQPQAWPADQPQAWSAFHQEAWSDDQQSWNESAQYPAQHQQYDDRAGNTWGGQYGHGC